MTDGSVAPASSTASGYASLVDNRIQYASLTEPASSEGQPPIPSLPDSIPPAPMQTSLPALSATSRAVNATATRVADESMRAERMRTIARRIRETMPDRLDEFMKETRQGASQGNWDAVMASWEVDLEFAGSRPIEHRASSLSDALRRDLPSSEFEKSPTAREPERSLQVSEPVPARVTSVTSPAATEPQTLPVPVGPLPASESFLIAGRAKGS